MKAAFSVWNEVIAPVFDVAREVRIVERHGTKLVAEEAFVFSSPLPVERVRLLKEKEVEQLVCGAISRPMLRMLEHSGVTVIPFVTGKYERVKQAWMKSRLWQKVFVMPGCWSQRRYMGRAGELFAIWKEENNMAGQQEGSGSGSGSGPGAGWRRRGAGAGPGGYCVCRNCGHREPHKRGVPCNQEVCPRCGGPMYRE